MALTFSFLRHIKNSAGIFHSFSHILFTQWRSELPKRFQMHLNRAVQSRAIASLSPERGSPVETRDGPASPPTVGTQGVGATPGFWISNICSHPLLHAEQRCYVLIPSLKIKSAYFPSI